MTNLSSAERYITNYKLGLVLWGGTASFASESPYVKRQSDKDFQPNPDPQWIHQLRNMGIWPSLRWLTPLGYSFELAALASSPALLLPSRLGVLLGTARMHIPQSRGIRSFLNPAPQIFRAKFRVMRTFFCALPIIFGFSAIQAVAAANNGSAGISAEPVARAKVQKIQTVKQQNQPLLASAEVASCAPAEEPAGSKTNIAIQALPKNVGASDIGSSEGSSPAANLADESPSVSNQDLGRDKLELSLESGPAKTDSPQSCKPE